MLHDEVVQVKVLLLDGAVDARLSQGLGRSHLPGDVHDLRLRLHADHFCHLGNFMEKVSCDFPVAHLNTGLVIPLFEPCYLDPHWQIPIKRQFF